MGSEATRELRPRAGDGRPAGVGFHHFGRLRIHVRFPLHALLAALSVLTAAMLLDLAFPLPLPSERDNGAVVLSREGTPLRAFADRGGIWRYPVEVDRVSPLYLQALLN